MARRILGVALAALALVAHAAAAQRACDSLRRPVGGDTLDLAPLSGFIEICARDGALCETLTSGYSPSVTTVGYFVPVGEWEAFRKGDASGFRHYLIAQLARSRTAADLPGLKAHIRSRQGNLRDNTDPPATLESIGRVPLGVLDETERSISFGLLMRLQPAAAAPPITMVATNSALVVRDQMLSLYVFHNYRAPEDVEAAKQTTKAWLACLNAANAPAR